MPVKQIKSEKVISLEDLDRQDIARQSGTKTIPLANLGDGMQSGETIEIQQRPNYQGKNIDKNVG